METEKPFAYYVTSIGDETKGVFKSLADAVRLMAPQETVDDVNIHACYGENRREVVPLDNYSKQDFATIGEASSFIDERNAEINELEKKGRVSLEPHFGAFRCSPKDSLEKQIKDYIASSPRVWLPFNDVVEL